MTPEWRCRTVACGYEWDTSTPHPTEEIIERLKREVDSQQRQLNISWKKESELATLLRLEKEGQRNDQTELEALRVQASRRERQLFDEGVERDRKERDKQRAIWVSFFALFIGLFIGRQLTDSVSGSLLGGILFAAVAYYVVKDWDKLKRGDF